MGFVTTAADGIVVDVAGVFRDSHPSWARNGDSCRIDLSVPFLYLIECKSRCGQPAESPSRGGQSVLLFRQRRPTDSTASRRTDPSRNPLPSTRVPRRRESWNAADASANRMEECEAFRRRFREDETFDERTAGATCLV